MASKKLRRPTTIIICLLLVSLMWMATSVVDAGSKCHYQDMPGVLDGVADCDMGEICYVATNCETINRGGVKSDFRGCVKTDAQYDCNNLNFRHVSGTLGKACEKCRICDGEMCNSDGMLMNGNEGGDIKNVAKVQEEIPGPPGPPGPPGESGLQGPPGPPGAPGIVSRGGGESGNLLQIQRQLDELRKNYEVMKRLVDQIQWSGGMAGRR